MIVPATRPPPEIHPVALDAARLFIEHAQRVAEWAGWLGGPSFDDATREEIVQDVFLTVQRLLPSFRGDAGITTWLYRITANEVRHRRRRDRWRRWLAGSSEDAAGTLPSPRPTPLEELERRQAAELVYRVLDRLGEHHRTVLILFQLEGLTGQEVAERMGVPVATVWVWLHRARARFGRELRALDGKRPRDAGGKP